MSVCFELFNLRKKLFFIVITFLLLTPNYLFSAKFANTYLEFELPESWHCVRESGQHICNPVNPEKRREAIIVMASKYKSAEDTMEKYFIRLKEARSVKDIKGTPYDSEIQFTKYNDINNTSWVDSQQLNSEVPNYITRYLATVQGDLGILITFSAHKDKFFKNYSADFYTMIRNIRVRSNIPAPSQGNTEVLGSGTDILGSLGIAGRTAQKKDSTKQIADLGIIEQDDTKQTFMLIGGGVVLFLLYVFIRRRKN